MELDVDLKSIQETRDLCVKARQAQDQLKLLSQKEVDRIVAALADAGYKAAHKLAEMAVAETGFGIVADKKIKNELATRDVFNYIREMKTVGVIWESQDKKLLHVAEPVGVIAGIIPVTNPTSTVLFKSIISLKSRNAIVFSPHPNAVNCIKESALLMQKAAENAGAPKNCIGIITQPTMKATEELMFNKNIALILATGGSGLVKSAYSAGKPAYGVGPGNVPSFIERTADVKKAVADIVASKSFDNGTVCASEQAVIVDVPIIDKVKQAFLEHHAYFLNDKEKQAVEKVLVNPQLMINPKLVGQSASFIAQSAGFSVPKNTSLLIAELDGVGKNYPLSVEKLSPVLAFYKANGWQAGCDRCMQLLNFGGMGHSLSIHSNNQDIIMSFALEKPAFRILVNTPSTHGAVGVTTKLPPSFTLGCGTFGGNITADNITPEHLINIKRVAFETAPIHSFSTSSNEVSGKRKLITENDVRMAIRKGQKIHRDRSAIVTPAALELGRQKKIFEND